MCHNHGIFFSPSQIHLTINNTTGCDIELEITSLDGSCNVLTSFSRHTILAGDHVDYTQFTTPSDYEIRMYDPNGNALTPTPIHVFGLCGGNTSQDSGTTTFPCNGGNNITATVTGGGPTPPWTVTVN